MWTGTDDDVADGSGMAAADERPYELLPPPPPPVDGAGAAGGGESAPSFSRTLARSLSFLRFIRRFWNQTLTWRSLRCSLHEISQRFWRVMYELPTNSFSRTIV